MSRWAAVVKSIDSRSAGVTAYDLINICSDDQKSVQLQRDESVVLERIPVHRLKLLVAEVRYCLKQSNEVPATVTEDTSYAIRDA